MATKKKKTGQQELKESAQNVWFAGLGALAAAEEEGGKLFRSLVRKGKKYERSLKNPVEDATVKVKGTVKTVRSAFDDQVGAALSRLGIASRKEIDTLTRKVDKLLATLDGKKKKTVRRKTTGSGS